MILAPPRVRRLAVLTNAAAALALILSWLVAYSVISEQLERRVARFGTSFRRRSRRSPTSASRDLRQQQMVLVVWMNLAVATRNWQVCGAKLFGLRRIDARTGGSVRPRAVLRRACFMEIVNALSYELLGSRERRHALRTKAHEPFFDDLERRHVNDPIQLAKARKQLYKQLGLSPFTGVWWAVGRTVLSYALLDLGTRNGRTISDRIAGTQTILDR